MGEAAKLFNEEIEVINERYRRTKTELNEKFPRLVRFEYLKNKWLAEREGRDAKISVCSLCFVSMDLVLKVSEEDGMKDINLFMDQYLYDKEKTCSEENDPLTLYINYSNDTISFDMDSSAHCKILNKVINSKVVNEYRKEVVCFD